MFEFQILQIAITTCLLLGQGQLVGTSGTVIVEQCSLVLQQAQAAPPEVKPESIVWLGMQLEVGDSESLVVRQVTSNSIAARYNLLVGDQIAKVEGQVVDSLPTLRAALADKQRPAVLVEVIRDCRSFEILIARPPRKHPSVTIAADNKVTPQVATDRTGRSLNLTTSAGTLVMACRPATEVPAEQRGLSLTALSASYYDRDGKLISVACEGDAKTVRTRLHQLPRELRGPAMRWLGPTELED
jgi:membrane-associated protease RseP (regulator of RpoE activity)